MVFMFQQQVNQDRMVPSVPRLSRTILVVEDHPTLREFVADALRAEGHRVLTAEDGLQAVAASRMYPGPIEVLLSDFELPEMDGSSAARKIVEKRPGMQVIIMSASPPQWDRLDPSWEFLGKPFSTALLLSRLSALLVRTHSAGA